MVDAITGFIGANGYWAVALLMCLENIVPPLPSELIMPFAGFVAARGDLNPVAVALAGAFGSVLGSLPWFWVAQRVGAHRLKDFADRHGRWLTVSRADIDKATRWFQRHGAWVLVFGRLVPGVRTLIAVPAGFSGMGWALFIGWTALGSLIWSALLTSAGYLMADRYDRIAAVLEPVTRLVFAAIVLTYIVRVVRAGRRRSSGDAEGNSE